METHACNFVLNQVNVLWKGKPVLLQEGRLQSDDDGVDIEQLMSVAIFDSMRKKLIMENARCLFDRFDNAGPEDVGARLKWSLKALRWWLKQGGALPAVVKVSGCRHGWNWLAVTVPWTVCVPNAYFSDSPWKMWIWKSCTVAAFTRVC